MTTWYRNMDNMIDNILTYPLRGQIENEYDLIIDKWRAVLARFEREVADLRSDRTGAANVGGTGAGHVGDVGGTGAFKRQRLDMWPGTRHH